MEEEELLVKCMQCGRKMSPDEACEHTCVAASETACANEKKPFAHDWEPTTLLAPTWCFLPSCQGVYLSFVDQLPNSC